MLMQVLKRNCAMKMKIKKNDLPVKKFGGRTKEMYVNRNC